MFVGNKLDSLVKLTIFLICVIVGCVEGHQKSEAYNGKTCPNSKTSDDHLKGDSCSKMSSAGRHQIPSPLREQILQMDREQQKFEQTSLKLIKRYNLTREEKLSLPQINVRSSLRLRTQSCPKPNLRCTVSSYRTADGSCNNLQNPRWGKSLECVSRLLGPEYGDDQATPRISSTGRPLPNPRVVSLVLHAQSRATADFSHMLMQWGQFLDHDISFSPLTQSANGSMIDCCQNNDRKHPACFEINIPADDPFYSRFGQTCMNFVRSTTCLTCNFGSRQQMNQLTAFIDASNVYGSTDAETRALRTLDGSGRLKVSRADNGGELLPPSTDPVNDQCSQPEINLICFKAGDSRVNQQPALAALHTLWVRQHNRVAGILRSINPRWREEQLFQETRRIIGAQMQVITYNEFLPLVIGEAAVDKNKLRLRRSGHTLYQPLDPTILSEFSTAAFRFGHSLIDGKFSRIDRQGRTQTFNLRDNFFNPTVLYNGDFDSILRGFIGKDAQRFDPFVDSDVRDHLYQAPNQPFGMDLVSINIQRGRDHGIPGYTKYLQFCFKEQIGTFRELDQYMPSEQRQKFQDIYARVEDIDLFSGGISEYPLDGAIVGPTFACIIGIQFKNLRFGDRYWFENKDQPGSFTPGQLASLRKTLLSKVICENGDNFKEIHGLVLRRDSDRYRKRSLAINETPLTSTLYESVDQLLMLTFPRGESNGNPVTPHLIVLPKDSIPFSTYSSFFYFNIQ